MNSDDMVDDLLNTLRSGGKRPAKPMPQARPLPQIRGRRMDDVLWVRAEDVAAALESQAPKANARLIAKLRSS